jgi:hypothetical protein
LNKQAGKDNLHVAAYALPRSDAYIIGYIGGDSCAHFVSAARDVGDVWPAWVIEAVHPPRDCGSLAQTEISRFVANSPELAAIRACILSPQSVDWISRGLSGPLSLPRKIAFPDSGDRR